MEKRVDLRSNLSETELLVGNIASATAAAKKSVTLADRSGHTFSMIGSRAIHAGALHAGGEFKNAANQFADAEQRTSNVGFPPWSRFRGTCTATCFCREGKPVRRAAGPREPWKSQEKVTGFSTLL